MTVDRIGIETLSVFAMPPVEFVELAADLGCRYISSGLTGLPINPHGFAPFSLLENVQLRRDMLSAMKARGVSISLGEGVNVRAGVDVSAREADLDALAELEVRRINSVSVDPDRERSVDQFGKLCELAAARGMEITLEPAPNLTIRNLDEALAVIRQIDRPDFRLLIDMMHFGRSGGTPEALAALDPGLIGYVQMCDVPYVQPLPDYMTEAMTMRRRPGEGELPLQDLLAAVPRDCVVSLEIPMLAEAQAGIGAAERLRPAVETTRAMLTAIELL